MDPQALKSFRIFHRVVSSIAATDLVRDDKLHAGFAASFGNGSQVHRRDWPDRIELRSLMLDFRKLIAEKEPSFINKVCGFVFKGGEAHGWSRSALEAVAEARKRFNGALDQPADFYSGTVRPSVRQLLDGWIDGDWFHSDAEKREDRKGYELAEGEDLSLALIIPALRVAIQAAVDLDKVISTHSGIGASRAD